MAAVTYKVCVKASTKQIALVQNATTTPTGYVVAGTFVHDAAAEDAYGSPDSHVVWHEIRDVLYKVKNETPINASHNGFNWPENITDMASWSISWDDNVHVTGVTVDANFSLVVGNTKQLTPVITPANATNKSVTYASADPTKATVSTSGLVTAVAAGSSVITVTTVDGAKTATVTATVTAS